jgi:aminopeptidase N
VVRAGALDGLADSRDERALPHLLAFTRRGQPPRARRAAVLSVPKIAWDRKTRETVEGLLDDTDPLLRADVARSLADLGDSKARAALRERLDRDDDARVRRRLHEALRDLAEPRKAEDALREEVDRLGAEHTDMKQRLAKLERLQSARRRS